MGALVAVVFLSRAQGLPRAEADRVLLWGVGAAPGSRFLSVLRSAGFLRTAGRRPESPELPKIISVDDHVVEPPHVWADVAARAVPRARAEGRAARHRHDEAHRRRHVRADLRSRRPQADCWVYEDLVYINKRHVAAVGFDRDDMTMSPITYDEMRPGCYEPKARVEDMDMNHVEASLCFPTFPRFCGQTFTEAKDRELGLACIYAYNDWMVEEWCGDSGGRLIPLPIIPLWDADLAAAEVRRNAERGVRAVCFSEIPPHLGLPSIHSGYWDPFFAACQDTEHRRLHAHRLVVAHAGHLAPTRRSRWPPPSASTTPWPR